MLADRIYINGTPTESAFCGIEWRRLLEQGYVYAAVNTDAHAPLWLERHLHHAANSYEKLYGTAPELDKAQIDASIRGLLYANGMPMTGNIVHIHLVAPADRTENVRSGGIKSCQPDVIITHDRTTIYHGYDLTALRPKAVITNYDVPFSGHRTAISLVAARYMNEFAVNSGANIALRTNRQGKLISSGDYPIFAVTGEKIFTPSPERGIGHSVERELMLRACLISGVDVTERDIDVADLPAMDEIMVFDPTGIRCILSIGDNFYYNLMGDCLGKTMSRLTEEGRS